MPPSCHIQTLTATPIVSDSQAMEWWDAAFLPKEAKALVLSGGSGAAKAARFSSLSLRHQKAAQYALRLTKYRTSDNTLHEEFHVLLKMFMKTQMISHQNNCRRCDN